MFPTKLRTPAQLSTLSGGALDSFGIREKVGTGKSSEIAAPNRNVYSQAAGEYTMLLQRSNSPDEIKMMMPFVTTEQFGAAPRSKQPAPPNPPEKL